MTFKGLTMNANLEKKPNDLNNDPLTEDRKRHFNTLIGLSDQFGNSLTSAFAKNIAEGKKFDDVLKSVRRSLVETGLKMALAPLQIGLSQSMKELSTGLMGTRSADDTGGLLGGLVKGSGRSSARSSAAEAAMRRRPGRPCPVSPMVACSRVAR